MAAADARRVALHLAQQRDGRVRELAVLLEHQPPLHEVGARVNQHALGFEAVAARASGLLLIVLERSRRARVHDEPHVRSIDAHPECHGRDDDVDALAEERILVAAALAVRESRVVRERRHTDAGQPRRKRIDLAARRAVDDARLAAMAREDLLELPLQRGPRKRAIEQVRPIERADELQRVSERELCRDVAPDARGRGRGERVKAGARQQLPQPAELAVLGPEIVSPLADAVRFVDGDEAHAARREQREKRLAPLSDQPLGRHVQQAIAAGSRRPATTSSFSSSESELLKSAAGTPLPTSVST